MSHPTALVYVERGDFAAGLAEARRALASAENAGQVDLAGHIGLTIAWIELERGNARACARELSKAKQSFSVRRRAGRIWLRTTAAVNSGFSCGRVRTRMRSAFV